MKAFETLTDALQAIANTMAVEVDHDNTEGLIAKLADLNSIGGLMAKSLANAKVLMDRELADNLKKIKKDTQYKWSPNEARDMSKAMSGDYIGLYQYAATLKDMLSKQIESYRSIISYRKTEMDHTLNE